MSVTVLIASNTQRLTTIEAVMAEITLGDGILFAESLIDQASAAVARYCGRVFAQQSYREVQGGWYQTGFLLLQHTPIVSISSVLMGTEAITDYRIEDAEAGILYRRAGWALWRGSEDEWTIDYLAGYRLPEQTTPTAPPAPLVPTLPDDLERAAIESIKVWFHERYVDSRIESRTLGDQRIDYGVQARRTALPVLAKDLLAEWRRVRIA